MRLLQKIAFIDKIAILGDWRKMNKLVSLNKEIYSMHTINPLGLRVLVKIIKADDVTKTGLYLPEGAKDAMAESVLAEVVAVASAIDDETSEEANISGIPLHATVLIQKNEGIKVPWDENLRIVETSEVLAIVDKVELT